MPETQSKNEIFISYSRADQPFVTGLIVSLEKIGGDLWVDTSDIPKGVAWWHEIKHGIEGANAFVFIITPSSLESEVCNWELGYAIENNKKIIPVIHVDPDKVFLKDLQRLQWSSPEGKQIEAARNWMALQRINFIFLREADDFVAGVREILNTARTDQPYVEAHTRLLQRAREWESKGRETSFLLRGTEISEAEAWLLRGVAQEFPPSKLHVAYITQSREYARKQRQRSLRIGGGGLVLLIGLLFFGLNQFQVAQEREFQRATQQAIAQTEVANRATQQAIAERENERARSLELAESARRVFSEGDPDLALALAILANKIEEAPGEAQQTLADLAYAPGTVRRYEGFQEGVFMPDGKHALAAFDESLELLDLENGAAVRPWSDQGYAMIASETGEAISFMGSRVSIWDFATGQTVNTFTGFDANITDAAISADGHVFIIGLENGIAQVWDARSQELITSFNWTVNHDSIPEVLDPTEWTLLKTHVAISPDGRTAVSAVSNIPNFAFVLEDPRLQWWNTSSGEIIDRLEGHAEPIESVAISSDGRFALSGGYNELVMWDLTNGSEMRRLYGPRGFVRHISIGPDSRQAIVSDETGLRLIELQSESELMNLDVGGFGRGTLVTAMAPGPVENSAIIGGFNTASSRGDATLIDILTGTTIHSFEWHGNTLYLGTSSDRNLAVHVHEEGIDILELTTGRTVYTYPEYTDGRISPDGELILGLANNRLDVLEAESGQVRNSLEGYISGEFSSDSRTILASTGSDLHLMDLNNFKVIHIYEGFTYGLLSPNVETILAVRGECTSRSTTFFPSKLNGEIYAISYETGEILRQIAPSLCVQSAVFSHNGETLLTGLQDGSVRLWDMLTGEEIRREWHSAAVTGVMFGESDSSAFSASEDGIIKQWKMMVSSQDLITWTCSHRYVSELSNEQRDLFQIGDSSVVCR
ncbi:MAG: TIR domain-containing protein [Anaerolineae bacterium]|nr:TIR domain-containing protein [Anaerolineae bacterium]